MNREHILFALKESADNLLDHPNEPQTEERLITKTVARLIKHHECDRKQVHAVLDGLSDEEFAKIRGDLIAGIKRPESAKAA